MAKKPSKAKADRKPAGSPRAAARRDAGATRHVAPPPEKSVAVTVAVRHQLEADRRWHLAHDETKVMGTDYHYDEQSMRQFLYGVHRSLAASKPPYRFEYDAAFVVTALGLKAPALITAINERTTE